MSKTLTIIIIVAAVVVIALAAYLWIAAMSQNATPTSTRSPIQNNGNSSTSTSFDIQGMHVDILQQGTGTGATAGDTVTVNYVGTLQNGTVFDSSIARKTPFTFVLGAGNVIKGWDLGVVGMKVGEVRKLTIPPALAYGAVALPNIPANSTLVFQITMLGITH